MSPERIAGWLATARPARPDALAARMGELVVAGGARAAGAATLAEGLALVGLAVLRGVTARRDSREADLALDLLAADAFVTYAFEAAAEEGADVGPLVARLLREAA